MERFRHSILQIQVIPGSSADSLLEALKSLLPVETYRVISRVIGGKPAGNIRREQAENMDSKPAEVMYKKQAEKIPGKTAQTRAVRTKGNGNWLEISLQPLDEHHTQLDDLRTRLDHPEPQQSVRRVYKLNASLPHFRASSLSNQQSRLALSGLNASLVTDAHQPIKPLGHKFMRRFVVQIFHLQATYIASLGIGGSSQPLENTGHMGHAKLCRRLEKTAARALYALGLQMGEVTITAGEDGQFTITSISAMPDYDEGERAVQAAQAIVDTLSALNQHAGGANDTPVLIGMDPEFLLYNGTTGKVVPASRYLGFTGVAGCDSLRYRGVRRFPLAELRPKPGQEPREVLVHLLQAFQHAYALIEDTALVWQAGGMPQRGFPLGGHLHFSGIPLTFELLQVLDNYLALPVAVLEDRRAAARRPRYGSLGDFRLQEHGGFEYRTLPSFLVSPLVAKGVVAIAALIAVHEEQLQRRPLKQEKIYAAFYKGDQAQLREVLPDLYADLGSLKAYAKYENYIAPFIEATLSGRTWDEAVDIRRLWKVEKHS
ncbi:putative amidoligase domain-containing protein [Paenibacillus fonticola]|uniref:putative amidoligase domain-containing protein n=1 Tax=Paenibacillus fonticola TaxID=379896 RepID=UPI000382D62C|nr:hypothetical protein [Paenibacillus fonticola]